MRSLRAHYLKELAEECVRNPDAANATSAAGQENDPRIANVGNTMPRKQHTQAGSLDLNKFVTGDGRHRLKLDAGL